SGYDVDPGCHRPKTPAGFLELPPCPPASRRRPASEASAVPPFQCCRICGSADGEKASRPPSSGRTVSHGQDTTVTVKRSTINGTRHVHYTRTSEPNRFAASGSLSLAHRRAPRCEAV